MRACNVRCEVLSADPYVPERDREVVLSREAYYWVPKEAFELVQSFLDRLFPRVPVQPFMMLLLQLNKVRADAVLPRFSSQWCVHGDPSLGLPILNAAGTADPARC